MSLHTKTHQPRWRRPGLRKATVRSNTPGTAHGRMADGERANLNEKGRWKQTPGKVSEYQGNFVDPLWVGSNSLGQSECVEGVYQSVNSLGPPTTAWPLIDLHSGRVSPVMSSSLSGQPQLQHGNDIYKKITPACVFITLYSKELSCPTSVRAAENIAELKQRNHHGKIME